MTTLLTLLALTLANVTADNPVFRDPTALLTPENIALLEKGETVMVLQSDTEKGGKSKGRSVAAILINSTPDTVWATLTDSLRLPDFMPRLRKVEIYDQSDAGIGLRYTMKIPFEGELRFHIRQRQDPAAKRLSWVIDRTQQNDINDTEGSWTLLPHTGGKTIALYSVRMDSGKSVPKSLEIFFVRRSIGNITTALRTHVEKLASQPRQRN